MNKLSTLILAAFAAFAFNAQAASHAGGAPMKASAPAAKASAAKAEMKKEEKKEMKKEEAKK
jgi:ribosomal protein L12E/L44/L45/RPP1/RPP2